MSEKLCPAKILTRLASLILPALGSENSWPTLACSKTEEENLKKIKDG